MKHSTSWMIFKEFIYGIQMKSLYGYKLVRAAKQSEKMWQLAQKESHKAVYTIYLEEKANICMICYIFE